MTRATVKKHKTLSMREAKAAVKAAKEHRKRRPLRGATWKKGGKQYSKYLGRFGFDVVANGGDSRKHR
jgi:hypothetical protein